MTLTDSKFAFLTSVRFWMIVVVAIAQGLKEQQLVDPGVIMSILTVIQWIFGSAATVGTIDRFSEKLGQIK